METAARNLPFPLEWLTPRVIGDAARTARYELQGLKMGWHTPIRLPTRHRRLRRSLPGRA